MKEYIDVCPKCDSEEIEMIGDREYNDFWACENCKAEFASFKIKEVNQKPLNTYED